MTIVVAIQSSLNGSSEAPIELGDPSSWSREDAKDFLYTLQRLAGGGGIVAQTVHEQQD
jgi:hypothetical protein